MIIRDNYESDEIFRNKISSVEEALGATEFSEIVKAFSDDDGTIEVEGDLGFTDGQVFPEEFELEIAKLNEGDISEKLYLKTTYTFLRLQKLIRHKLILLKRNQVNY